jgi:cytidine deaminase
MVSSQFNENELIEQAKLAMGNAYAPYSGVKVGAALLDKSGRIFLGCNVENASYGLTICAERTAIGCAITSGSHDFTAIAIVNSTGKAFSPCGACCQVLAEFSDKIKVIMVSQKGKVARSDIRSLLPDAFKLKPG